MDARVLLGLTTSPHGSVSAAAEDALASVLDAVLLDRGVVWDRTSFDALVEATKARYVDDLVAVASAMSRAVQDAGRLGDRLADPAPPEWDAARTDMTRQIGNLVFDGMAVTIGADRIEHVPRYLAAVEIRLDKLREGVRADLERMALIHRLEAEHGGLVTQHGLTAALDAVRWMIEELRVQQWAQQLGTSEPVSAQRIRRTLDRVRRGTMAT